MEVLGTAASVIEVATFAAKAFQRLSAAAGLPGPDDREVAKALDAALNEAAQAAGVDLHGRADAFDGLRSVLLGLDAEDLSAVIGGDVTPDRFLEVADVGPVLGELMIEFGWRFRQQLITRASKPDNPLFGVAVLSKLVSLERRVDLVYEQVTAPRSSDSLPSMATLPPPVAAVLQELSQQNLEMARQLVGWLCDPSTRLANLSHLIAEGSNSFIGHVRMGWQIVVDLAMALDAEGLARDAIRLLVEVDERPAHREYWRARAALLSDQPAEALMELEREDFSENGRRFVELMRAIADQDGDRIASTADAAKALCEEARRVALHAKAQVLRARGELDDAIAALESLNDTGTVGIQLDLATTLLVRANAERAPDRLADGRRALGLARAGIASRRAWSGNSAAAVLVACQAAATVEDWETVRHLGSAEYGEATEAEAADPNVAELVGVASGLLGDHQAALNSGASASTKAWVRAMSLDRTPGSEGEAVAAFQEAAASASNPLELERAVRGLATLGVHPLPRLAELVELEPARARAFDALAQYRKSRSPAALADLRAAATETRVAAAFLVTIELEDGRPELAAELAQDAARRFNDPHLYVVAAGGLLASDPVAADNIAAHALEHLPHDAPVRRELRLIRVQIAHATGDPGAIRAAAELAVADGVHDVRLLWLLVECDLVLSKYADAWARIESNGLAPSTEPEAVLFVTAHALGASSDSLAALDVLDRFSTSHDVMANGLLLHLTVRRDDALDQTATCSADANGPIDEERQAEIARRYGAHLEAFVRTFPDSSAIWSRTIDPDDPASALAALEEEMPQYPADAAEALSRLLQHIDTAELPVGAVAAVVGRPHLPILVAGQYRSVPTIAASPRTGAERDAARNLLNRDVIVDISTLAAISLTPSAWRGVLSSVARLSVLSSQRRAIEFQSTQPRAAANAVRTPDGVRFIEVGESDAHAVQTRLRWMKEIASELPQELPALSAPLTVLGDVELEGCWAHALHAAKRSGRPLLVDDPALAELARAHGIEACGSYALLMAAGEAGLVDGRRLKEFNIECFERMAVDLPMTPEEVFALAESQAFPLGPVVSVLSRPQFWREPSAVSVFDRLARALLGKDLSSTWALVAATVNGSSRAVPADSAPGYSSAIVARLVFQARVQPSEFRVIVGALRAAWTLNQEPIVVLARSIFDVLKQNGQSAETARDFLLALGSGLDPEDQNAIARSVITM